MLTLDDFEEQETSLFTFYTYITICKLSRYVLKLAPNDITVVSKDGKVLGEFLGIDEALAYVNEIL